MAISIQSRFTGSYTDLRGISDKGLVVGRYFNSDGVFHGFILKLPGTFVSYDYPGATSTIFSGVNSKGEISGSYDDSAGSHGLIVQVK